MQLNGVLDKPVPTSAASLAPDNANQNAYANGESAQSAPRATSVSQPATTAPAAARSGNPFRN